MAANKIETPGGNVKMEVEKKITIKNGQQQHHHHHQQQQESTTVTTTININDSNNSNRRSTSPSMIIIGLLLMVAVVDDSWPFVSQLRNEFNLIMSCTYLGRCIDTPRDLSSFSNCKIY